MVIRILLGGRLISTQFVPYGLSLRETKLAALRQALAAGELNSSQALQVTFEVLSEAR